ncbi:hypothetical protein SUNI508_01115 [Seiridium unicorne]|uniref:Uncharacterized protein n=1 Tax=Seiridium unicorne TaxID=138068 RepID=A0ABR2UWT2_9PEZI
MRTLQPLIVCMRKLNCAYGAMHSSGKNHDANVFDVSASTATFSSSGKRPASISSKRRIAAGKRSEPQLSSSRTQREGGSKSTRKSFLGFGFVMQPALQIKTSRPRLGFLSRGSVFSAPGALSCIKRRNLSDVIGSHP